MEIDGATGELIEYRRGDIAMTRPAEQVLAEAHEAASALARVLKGKVKPVIMNGEQYLEFEDWQTVGRFYGVTARVSRTSFISFGNVQGFEATADAIRSDGQVISSADSMCLNDEEKWSTRPKYGYVDGKRTKVSDEPVPLFQLRSMAQTRACAKALRNVLAWVVVLAGFKPNVAEEMEGVQPEGDGKPPLVPPKEMAPPAETKADAPPLDKRTTQQTLKDELEAYQAATGCAVEDALIEFSTFGDPGKERSYKGDILKMSPGWAGSTLGKLRKAVADMAQREPGADG